MSGKSEKKLRRLVHNEYEVKVMEYENKKQTEIVADWLANLMRSKLTIRLKVAWKIILGSRNKKGI